MKFLTRLASLGLIAPSVYVLVNHIDDLQVKLQLTYVFLLAIGGYILTVFTIPMIQSKMPALLTGKDLCKKGTERGDIPVSVINTVHADSN